MITEEMLKAAAAEADQAIRDSLPDPEACEHEFSPSFQKKMRRISRRAAHPMCGKLLRSAACLALTVLALAGVWLAADTTARTALVGWVKETYLTYSVYHFSETDAEEGPSAEYDLSWIPDGYTEWERISFGGGTTVCYANEQGQLLEFSYISSSSTGYWFIEKSNTTEESIRIGDVPAQLYRSNSPDAASAVVWTSSQGDTAFYLSGFFCEEELIKLAESVEP